MFWKKKRKCSERWIFDSDELRRKPVKGVYQIKEEYGGLDYFISCTKQQYFIKLAKHEKQLRERKITEEREYKEAQKYLKNISHDVINIQ